MTTSLHWTFRYIPALLVLLALGRASGAPEEPTAPLDRKALDARIAKSLSEVYDEGSQQLYNKGYTTEAVHLFQGALMGIEPLLDHHPDLQESLHKGLVRARRMRSLDDRAWYLRELIFDVQGVVRAKPITPVVIGEGTTLWERLGGEANVRQIVSDWIDACSADPNLNFSRDGRYKTGPEDLKAIKSKIVSLTSEIAGGAPPGAYKGKSLREAHKDMKITEAEYRIAVDHLERVMIRNRVKRPDSEFILAALEMSKAKLVSGPDKVNPVVKTPWELIGEARAKKVIDDFVDASLADPKVNASRNGKLKYTPEQIAGLKDQLLDLASSVTEGPRTYSGPPLQVVFKGVGVTETEFNAAMGHLEKAMLRNQMGKAETTLIMGILRSKKPDIVESNGDAK